MDTYSATEVARRLGINPPRVLRAIRRLGLTVERRPSGAFALTEEDVARLATVLDTTPAPNGLTRVEARVLAAVSRSPRGLASARAVAHRAGVSPTAAGRAVSTLVGIGLVRRDRVMLAAGSAREADLVTIDVTSPHWRELAPHIAQVRLPEPGSGHLAKRVPYYLRHLFWNTAPPQLEVSTSAEYIAKRLLATRDPDGLAWGSTHLPASAWAAAEKMRGLSPKDRALAQNLARNTRVAA